jgi:ABC-type polysaccharide/polyol phosphate transport system ATPase subunit
MREAILVRHLWKSFPKYRPGIGSLKSMFSFGFGKEPERVWALQDVSFTVNAGESVAILGRNGSGKSTLLGILSKVYRPTKGEAVVNGRVAPLLELGAGFHPDLTGRENIYLNGAILGLSREEVDRRLDDIIGFSELGPFIDTPIKTYSSGMQMRLGFAIAVQTKPDALLVDEVLAVGDEAFQHKCYRQIERFQKEGRTILFVSHDLEAVKRVAPRTIWISRGKLLRDGPTEAVIPDYLDAAHEEEAAQILEENG